MHRYVTDLESDKMIYAILFVCAIAVSYLLTLLARVRIAAVPWWISMPTPFAMFGVLYRLFNRYFWRVKLPSGRTISGVPDLSGEWEGVLTTDYTPGERELESREKRDAKLTVRQTWRRILLTTETDRSISQSTGAVLSASDPLLIRYTYQNNPSNESITTMTMHTGTCELQIRSDETLQGEYYTDRNRRTTGTLRLSRRKRHEGNTSAL